MRWTECSAAPALPPLRVEATSHPPVPSLLVQVSRPLQAGQCRLTVAQSSLTYLGMAESLPLLLCLDLRTERRPYSHLSLQRRCRLDFFTGQESSAPRRRLCSRGADGGAQRLFTRRGALLLTAASSSSVRAAMPHPIQQLQPVGPDLCPPLPPRSHPKQSSPMTFPSTSTTSSLPSTSTPFPATSRLQSFLHSSLTASPLSKPPPPSEKGPSSEPPPLALPSAALLTPPTTLPASSPFSRASTAPSAHLKASASPTSTPRYRYPGETKMDHSPTCRPSHPAMRDMDGGEQPTLPSLLDAPFPTALPAIPSPPSRASPTSATSAASSSSTALPALTRLSSSAPISLSDFAFWTDGQVQLRDEISSLHHFGSRRRDEDDGVEEEVLKVSNRALQSLVNAAQDSGNVRHTLLVLSYHLRHLIEQQRKHEARIKFRQRQLQKAQLLLAASHTPGDLTAPLPPLNSSTLPLPTSSTSSPPTFPGEGHWLLCMMSNVRLILQTLLERLPCHHRELFFQHLRRRPDLAGLQPAQSPRQADYNDGGRSPMPDDAPALVRSRSCNDASLSPTASSEHLAIVIPLSASALPHPSMDRGEDVLRMLLSTLMQAVVHAPVSAATEALHLEVLALLFSLLEAHDTDECEVHGGDDGADGLLSHRTFLQPLLVLCEGGEGKGESKEPAPSKLAFRLMHALLLHYCGRAERDDRDQQRKTQRTNGQEDEGAAGDGDADRSSSTLKRLFGAGLPSLTSLSSLVSSSFHRSLRFFFPPSSDYLFADQSALLSLWFSYQFGSSASLSSNPLRQVLGQLRDGMDRKGRIGPSADPAESLSFDRLYRSIALTSGKEWTCVFLFHLLNVNRAFRVYVIAHEALDDLLLPLLHVLYLRMELSHNWVYMIINCFLVLSQEAEFNRCMHQRRVEERVPWFTDHKLRSLSMHDLVLIVLLRLLHKNVQVEQSSAAYNNALAALANMAAAPSASVQASAGGSLLTSAPLPTSQSASTSVLHPYAAHLLVSLFSDCCGRMSELLHAALQASPSRSIQSIEQIPSAFNTFEAIGALSLDLLVHYLLPAHLVGHTAALYYLCVDDVRSRILRLQRMLEATRVRVFQHIAEVDAADEGAEAKDSVEFDLLADLTDFLSAFPSTVAHLTPALPTDALATFSPHVSRHLRLLPRNAPSSSSSTAPFPFDPLQFRGHYVYEERDNSCGYFWPHFRVFAARLGVGRGAGKGAGEREGRAGKKAGADDGDVGVSEEEIRRLLESFDGDYDEMGWDDGR